VLHGPPLNTPTVSLETDRILHIQLLLSGPFGEIVCVCVRARSRMEGNKCIVEPFSFAFATPSSNAFRTTDSLSTVNS
jgi:hypothetical protein